MLHILTIKRPICQLIGALDTRVKGLLPEVKVSIYMRDGNVLYRVPFLLAPDFMLQLKCGSLLKTFAPEKVIEKARCIYVADRKKDRSDRQTPMSHMVFTRRQGVTERSPVPFGGAWRTQFSCSP